MIFLPHPIEERDHPVIEDVEEAPERSVLVARAIHHQLSVLMRKNSQGTDGAHKRNHHLRRRALLLKILSQVVNLARRKRERRSGAKAHDFARGVSVLAHWTAVSMNALEQAHGLKERKPIRLGKQLLRLRRTCFSAPGGPCFCISFPLLVIATRWFKKITQADKPRKLS